MGMEPEDLGQGPEGQVPGASSSPGDDLRKRVEQLEQENAKLREDRRHDRAAAFGERYGLTPTQVELLSTLKADEIEAKAKALHEEQAARSAPEPTPAGGGEPQGGAEPPAGETPTSEPPNADVLEKAGEGDDGSPPGEPALGFQDELARALNDAVQRQASPEEFAAIQREFRERQRAGR